MSDILTVESIRADSRQVTFPCYVLNECKIGIAFFSAAFGGRNDVIHLYDHGVSNIWLNDVDTEKLSQMGDIYDASSRLLPGDCYTISRDLADQGCIFDIVTCDPSTNMMKRTLIEEFDAFDSIASKWLIIGCSNALLEEIDCEPTPQSLQTWFRTHGHPTVTVDSLVLRNSNRVYWAAFRKAGRAGLIAPEPPEQIASTRWHLIRDLATSLGLKA